MAKKNVVPAYGARLLRRVAKHILAEPLRYDQNFIIERGTPGGVLDDDSSHVVPACGTVACIGGWLALLTASNPRRVHSFSVPKLAEILGVESDQVYRLIAYIWQTGPSGWPLRFAKRYNNAKSPLAKAKIANERIEYFITAGK